MIRLLTLSVTLLWTSASFAGLTANKVWFEFRPGFYRVFIQYTIPALRELREASVEFKSKEKAKDFYFKLLKGAEFELGSPEGVRFVQPPSEPDPW